MKELNKFIKDQLSVWQLASSNFRALKTAPSREVDVFGLKCRIQYNPRRVISSTADTSPAAIASRKCFLCADNRPKEQFHLGFEGRKGRNYHIQINPYPIFRGHLVIVRDEHIPQEIWHHFPDMLDFAARYKDYLVFYNGPSSGASAPDHLHFQAIPKHNLPLEDVVDEFLDHPGEPLATVKDASLYKFDGYARGVFALKATASKSLAKLFYRLLDCTDRGKGEEEPMFNLYAYVKNGEYRTIVVMRSAKRSHHFYSEGADHLTISPGAADIAGLFVAPFREDYDKADTALLEELLSEVCISEDEQNMIVWRLTRHQEKISVGLLSAKEIRFEIISDGAGPQTVKWHDGRISYNGMLYDELYFDSMTLSTLFAEASFILYDVVIGIDFHWQQKRTFKYAGGLKFIVEGDRITAVNCIGMEDYLMSVISSEMKSSASIELLKAHAVISRSWLKARLRDHKAGHEHFDVCADDHCQRYQGLTMAVGDDVCRAIDRTWGQVLEYGGDICDTRYSKCCGGRTELFSTCWEDVDLPYLQSVEDPFCDCENSSILSQVLNDYDLHTADFHDWTVQYTTDELSELVRTRTGIDFGTIVALEAVERGPSGRIKYLRITGTLREEVIGKELAIRKALSSSHLKSSAFEIEKSPDGFVLKGRGWGHGVGVCQIGAAAMAAQGYDYRQILSHYYVGAEIK
ncbi:spoIID/LytB domain protein [Bacteroides sp. CAG:1060]|nr:spoIID/LytB domain protein [Bacteroides sp. CAG:1060]